jgi:YidC/Oxa1 family membrane protein insertase
MAAFFRAITEGLGTILSFFYDVIPSYGIAIILLTITVRVVLLPLAIKQIRSQQAMQRLQPHLKALEQKYKGNRQKLNEERMKLMKEHQVNPLGGCLPLLLQLPIFIALYQVLTAGGRGTRYLPEGSALVRAIQSENASFLGMNLACNPSSAGRGILEVRGETLDCGSGFAAAIPFFVMVGLMVFTTYYQQKQMQVASGQQQAQMQLLLRIMPLFLGFISLSIPAGVLVYWVTTNLWQVGQQYVMLRAKARADVEGSPAIPPKPSGPKPSGPKPSGRSPGKPGGRNAGSRKKRRKR